MQPSNATSFVRQPLKCWGAICVVIRHQEGNMARPRGEQLSWKLLPFCLGMGQPIDGVKGLALGETSYHGDWSTSLLYHLRMQGAWYVKKMAHLVSVFCLCLSREHKYLLLTQQPGVWFPPCITNFFQRKKLSMLLRLINGTGFGKVDRGLKM